MPFVFGWHAVRNCTIFMIIENTLNHRRSAFLDIYHFGDTYNFILRRHPWNFLPTRSRHQLLYFDCYMYVNICNINDCLVLFERWVLLAFLLLDGSYINSLNVARLSLDQCINCRWRYRNCFKSSKNCESIKGLKNWSKLYQTN